MKILLTGGSGLLGTELKKYFLADTPSHKELDLTQPIKLKKKYDLIIHAAAYTDVAKAEIEQDLCYRTNVTGTSVLINATKGAPFVYISSEYAGAVCNFYSQTKLLAERVVANTAPVHLIIRTLFKPRPFPYPKAFVDQFTMGDYVDEIARLIELEIECWDRKTSRLVYVGTGRKSIYELAKKTSPDVGKISIEDIKDVHLPGDYV